MEIKVGCQYKTRDGRKARIYATDGFGAYRIHGAGAYTDGVWGQLKWTVLGRINIDDPSDPENDDSNDLISEWKEPRSGTFWVNVYERSHYHESKESADHGASSKRLACVEVKWKEGDGL